MAAQFKGFSKQLITFLRELSENNNRKWFLDNKQRYESDVLAPSLEFIEAMQAPLKKISPHFLAIPNRSGGSLMRIYRDTRFSKDKTPYKTNVGIHFRHEVGKDVHSPGFYFHIDPRVSFICAGVWHPDNEALRRIRLEIVEQAAKWKRITRSKKLLSVFRFEGDSLQRPPRDFDPKHPLIDDIRRKDHIVMAEMKLGELTKPDVVKMVTNQFKLTKPYVQFLCDALKLPC